jgi:hypothetical protein
MPAVQKQHQTGQPSKDTSERNPQALAPVPATMDILAGIAAPQNASPANILRLQRLVGNHAVAGLVQRQTTSQQTQPVPARSLSRANPSIQRMQVLSVRGTKANPLTYVGFEDSEAEPPVGAPHSDGFVYSRKAEKDKEFPGYKVYLQQVAVVRKKSDAEKVQEAWDRKKTELNGNLFAGAPGSGTFEYVAQEFFPSMESEDEKQAVREMVYTLVKSPTTYQLIPTVIDDDDTKKLILKKILKNSLSSYDELESDLGGGNKKNGALSPEEIQTLAQGAKVQGPDTVQGSLPKAVALGYHGTNQPISVVAEKAGQKNLQGATGWGGLQKGKDLGFKQTAFALDAPWNPLKKKLATPSYRKGVNWDNELLSTVSVATHPTPAIKFPFPPSGTSKATTYLYAVIVEKAYPTFKIQKDPFPEVAIDKVDPEDIIGMTMVSKYYDKGMIEQTARDLKITQAVGEGTSNELFAYYAGGFIPNFRLATKYPQVTIDAMVKMASEKIVQEIGPSGTWGIYDALKIKKP